MRCLCSDARCSTCWVLAGVFLGVMAVEPWIGGTFKALRGNGGLMRHTLPHNVAFPPQCDLLEKNLNNILGVVTGNSQIYKSSKYKQLTNCKISSGCQKNYSLFYLPHVLSYLPVIESNSVINISSSHMFNPPQCLGAHRLGRVALMPRL